MDIGFWIGFVGGLLLTVALISQLLKMWEQRDRPFEEISRLWLVSSLLGTICMFFYGFVILQPSLVVLNITGLFSLSLMIWLYHRAKNRL